MTDGDDSAFASERSNGLTKREEFAKAAMQGLLADPERNLKPDAYAKNAVEMADALIAELNNAAH